MNLGRFTERRLQEILEDRLLATSAAVATITMAKYLYGHVAAANANYKYNLLVIKMLNGRMLTILKSYIH
jgi:uncharacterized membrane protein YjgN (DUF898 family)